jgi:pyruvate,water dikinase
VNRDLFHASQTQDLDEFLRRHGHRASSSSWEIFSPRWVENPEAVQRLIRPYRENVLSDPTALAEAQEARSQQALVELKRRSRTPAGRLLVSLVSLTREYLQLREDQRYAFDRLLFAMKGILLRHGCDLWGQEHQHLVAYLWAEELHSDASASTLLQTAQDRHAEWSEMSRAPIPPVFLNPEKIFERSATDPRLRGLGISSGVHTGRVRILKSPEEAEEFQAGDVLVASATDPGWTPLFLLAGAVVLELGSLLSHGAVLAREYGIPAVVNVPEVLEKLAEGQKITVDGTRGVVWLDPRQ